MIKKDEKGLIPVNFNKSEMAEICEINDYLKTKPMGISTYLCKAFDFCDSNIYSITRSNYTIFEIYRFQYFSTKYNIQTLDDLVKLLKKRTTVENQPLPKATRILLTFHLDVPLEKKVYNILKPLPNKDRISLIINTVREFTLSGYDLSYLDYSVDNLLGNLKSCYNKNDSETLEKVIEIINAPIETRFTPFFMRKKIEKYKQSN